MILEVGRVCMKVVGREAGKYCVVVKPVNKSFVNITGPKILTGVKRRKTNIQHVEPTQYVVEIKEDANDEEVLSAFQKAGLVEKLGLKKPSAAEVKQSATKQKTEKPVAEKVEKEKPDKKK